MKLPVAMQALPFGSRLHQILRNEHRQTLHLLMLVTLV